MKRALICLLSAGWIVPMWLAAHTYLGFWRGDGWTLLAGGKAIGSFPVIAFSQKSLAVGSVWLGVAIVYWTWKASAGHKTQA